MRNIKGCLETYEELVLIEICTCHRLSQAGVFDDPHARLINHESRNVVREQGRALKLWTWMTVLAVAGAWLITWLFLLVLKANKG